MTCHLYQNTQQAECYVVKSKSSENQKRVQQETLFNSSSSQWEMAAQASTGVMPRAWVAVGVYVVRLRNDWDWAQPRGTRSSDLLLQKPEASLLSGNTILGIMSPARRAEFHAQSPRCERRWTRYCQQSDSGFSSLQSPRCTRISNPAPRSNLLGCGSNESCWQKSV